MKKLLLFLGIYFFSQVLLADTIQPISNGSWQNTANWPGGQLPGELDDVVIPQGMAINLVGTVKVKTITVNGILRAVNGASINLEAEWIMVDGASALFEVGTENQPYSVAGGCAITLTGPDDGDNMMGMGDKFIIAMNGGTVELHGEDKISWTHLGSDADIGSTQITMSEPVDWKVDDEIVIVSSRLNWNEAEKRTITGISNDSLVLTLNTALNFPHVSAEETYTRSTDSKNWTADLRAEVGVLTHNVKVQGDITSEINGFGGHMMCMMNSTMNASGIELYRMGQKAKLARYPWHWHMLHDFGTGQYLKNSSVHHSFNRAVTIHGTNFTTVDNNFLYEHIGHGVFFEDGSERFNTISNNVTLLSIRPQPGEEVTPSDNQFNEPQNRTPSSYWITNPNNTFENNVAAGSEGTGYWFAFPKTPMGLSASDSRFAGIEPYKEPLGLFKGNKAHSCMSGFDIFDQLSSSHSIIKNSGWQNSSQHLIEDCTWYANQLSIYTGIGGGVGDKVTYTGNLIFYNNVFADSRNTMMLASYSQVQESAIIANTGKGIFTGTTQAYRTYDGAGQVRDCHLVGWTDTESDFIEEGGAATKHTNHRLSGITTDDGNIPNINIKDYDIPFINNDDTPQNISHPRQWNMVLLDEDGSFTGVPNSSIVSNHPIMLVGDEVQPSNWVNAFRSSHLFALNYLKFDGLSISNYPNATFTRTKAGTPTASAYDMYGYKDQIMVPVIVNEGFMYTYTFESLPGPKNVNVILDDAEVGDSFLIKFTDFGKLGGLSLTMPNSALPSESSLVDLENSNQTAYYTETNGDLYVKYVATQFLQDFDIDWNTDFVVPMLDTDGDLISDRDEIEDGLDPFSSSNIEFNFNNSSEGFASTDVQSTATSAATWQITTDATNTNPVIDRENLGLIGDDFSILTIRIKSDQAGDFVLNWATEANNTYSSSREATVNYTQTGTFVNLEFDLSSHAEWSSNTITKLRLNIPTASGTSVTEVDWIRGPQAILNIDVDGDGYTTGEEDLVCRNDNDESDLGFVFHDSNEGFTTGNMSSNFPRSNFWILFANFQNQPPRITRSELSFDASAISELSISLDAGVAGNVQLFWETSAQPGYDNSRRIVASYTDVDEWQKVVFNTSANSNWTGTITSIQIRLPADPLEKIRYLINKIESQGKVVSEDQLVFEADIDNRDFVPLFGSTATVCSGNSVVLRTDSGYAVDWSDSSGFISNGVELDLGNVVEQDSGTYTVSYNVNGCSYTKDFELTVDASSVITIYADIDEDGFGDPNNSITSCNTIAGYVLNFGDCDDTDDTINPLATEIPDDGIDQDCDGSDLIVSPPAQVQSIAVNGPDTVNLGSTGQMSVAVSPFNATDPSVLYSVDDTNIATVDANSGVITSVALGTVFVTATAQDGSGVTGTKSVQIVTSTTQIALGWDFDNDEEGWTQSPNNLTVSWNSNGYLDCSPTGNDPYVYNTISPTFSTSNVNYLEVRVRNGTSNTSGRVYIWTTTTGVFSIPYAMTANNTNFETVVVDLSTISGWSNSLSVTNVRLDPNSNGATGIVSYDYVYFVDTYATLPVTAIVVSGPDTVEIGNTGQMTVAVSPSNATDPSVLYSVDDTNIATIDANTGVLTPVSIGTVTVTATAQDASGIIGTKDVDVTGVPLVALGWDFNTGDDGWTQNPNNLTVSWDSNGYLDFSPTGSDPFLYNTTSPTFSTANVNYLEVSVRNQTSATIGHVYIWTTTVGPLAVPVSMTASSTSFETVIVDLSTINGWSNSLSVTNVRFDPNNNGATGTISYDHVYFVDTYSGFVPVTGIIVSGQNTVDLGSTGQMSVAVSPSNATNQSVLYSVNDTNIATIDVNTGVLTPVTAGTVIVTATAQDGSNITGTKSVEITNIIFGWDFNTGDDGWTNNPNNMTVSWDSNGYLDCSPTGGDPYVYNTTSPTFNTTDINYLEVRVKNGTSNTSGRIYIWTTTTGVFSIPYTMTANNGNFETIVVDLSTVSSWSNSLSVTNVRFDPNSNGATGTISYDHVYFTNIDSGVSNKSSSTKTLEDEDEDNLAEVRIHPNPVSQGQSLYINLPSTEFDANSRARVSIHDLSGKLIYFKDDKVINDKLLPISTDRMQSGMYLLSVQLNNSIKQFRFVVK